MVIFTDDKVYYEVFLRVHKAEARKRAWLIGCIICFAISFVIFVVMAIVVAGVAGKIVAGAVVFAPIFAYFLGVRAESYVFKKRSKIIVRMFKEGYGVPIGAEKTVLKHLDMLDDANGLPVLFWVSGETILFVSGLFEQILQMEYCEHYRFCVGSDFGRLELRLDEVCKVEETGDAVVIYTREEKRIVLERREGVFRTISDACGTVLQGKNGL